jgi:hypothetical protein
LRDDNPAAAHTTTSVSETIAAAGGIRAAARLLGISERAVRLRRDRERLAALERATPAPAPALDANALAAALVAALAPVLRPAAPAIVIPAETPPSRAQDAPTAASPLPEVPEAPEAPRATSPREAAASINPERLLVFGDLHAPFGHRDAAAFLRAVRDAFEPTAAICTGDEIDAQALSAFGANPNLPSAGDELRMARLHLLEIHGIFPTLHLVRSNHGQRMQRAAKAAGLPAGAIVCPGDLLFGERLPDGRIVRPKGVGLGWVWHSEIDLVLPGVGRTVIAHDLGTRLDRIALEEGVSVIQGDHHKLAGVQWIQTRTGTRFTAAAGCLIDPRSPAFSYDRKGARRPVLGCLVVESGVPRFVPMLTDDAGRWTGFLG